MGLKAMLMYFAELGPHIPFPPRELLGLKIGGELRIFALEPRKLSETKEPSWPFGSISC